MATDKLNNFNFTFSVRNAPLSGPSSSDAWNDSFSEIASDLSSLASEWNSKLVTIIEGLPDGSLDTSVNVFQNGLDGKNVWVDKDIESTDSDLTFFDTSKDRPVTVKEALVDLYQYIDNQLVLTQETIIDQQSGLTTDQKNRIGANVFDATQTSNSSSLDGKSERSRLNLIQVAADLYGVGYSLDNDGNTNLTNSVMRMVDALLELHNGNWDDDIALSHTGTVTLTQAEIASCAPGSDSLVGVPANLEEDIDQVRTYLRLAKGTTGWQSAYSALYAGGPDSPEDLFTSTAGTGTKTATNPWGYNYSDIDGLNTRLEAIKSFVGQDSQTDSSAVFSGITFVPDHINLEQAIIYLDRILVIQSGIDLLAEQRLDALQTFTGQGWNTDSFPMYAAHYITDGDSLETACTKLDNINYIQSGIDIVHDNRLNSIKNFIGQDTDTDYFPLYSGSYLQNGESLELSCHRLDLQIATNDNTYTNYFNYIQDFTGQDDASDTTPSYLQTSIVSDGDSLETAIGKIDWWLWSGIDTNTITATGLIIASGNLMVSGEVRMETDVEVGQDVEITNSGYGVIMYSGNGQKWRLQVGNLGEIVTTPI